MFTGTGQRCRPPKDDWNQPRTEAPQQIWQHHRLYVCFTTSEPPNFPFPLFSLPPLPLSSIPADDNNRIVLRPLERHPDCQRDFINACYVDVSHLFYTQIPYTSKLPPPPPHTLSHTHSHTHSPTLSLSLTHSGLQVQKQIHCHPRYAGCITHFLFVRTIPHFA